MAIDREVGLSNEAFAGSGRIFSKESGSLVDDLEFFQVLQCGGDFLRGRVDQGRDFPHFRGPVEQGEVQCKAVLEPGKRVDLLCIEFVQRRRQGAGVEP